MTVAELTDFAKHAHAEATRATEEGDTAGAEFFVRQSALWMCAAAICERLDRIERRLNRGESR